jgi:hypothetical protein
MIPYLCEKKRNAHAKKYAEAFVTEYLIRKAVVHLQQAGPFGGLSKTFA